MFRWLFKPSATVAPIDPASAPYASRIDPAWTAYWITRTLTDEPGKGMGAPFWLDDADMFLRACGLKSRAPGDPPDDPARLERMWAWLDSHRD